MTKLLPPSVAIAVATLASPKFSGDARRHLIGVALCEVEEAAQSAFIYRLRVRTIPSEISEDVLVDWLTKHLPAGRLMIGWHLATGITPVLLDATNAATPAAARSLVDALRAAVTMDSVDLADDHGGIAAPSFGDVCTGAGGLDHPKNAATKSVTPQEGMPKSSTGSNMLLVNG